jgi:hypothetical protein
MPLKRTGIKAIYRGQDGSLGYERNKEYSLAVYTETGKPITIIREENGSAGQCEYSNMGTFLENWDNIRRR